MGESPVPWSPANLSRPQTAAGPTQSLRFPHDLGVDYKDGPNKSRLDGTSST